MIKNTIKDLENNIKDDTNAIKQAEYLLAGLVKYDKNIINKTFFEKYFSLYHTKESLEYTKDKKLGDTKTDWKGNILTEFKLSEPNYNFQKGKIIYLSSNQYIEDLESNKRDYIEKKTRAKIELMNDNRNYAINKKNLLVEFNLSGFIKEYKELLKKYNGTGISYDIHDEIKFLN